MLPRKKLIILGLVLALAFAAGIGTLIISCGELDDSGWWCHSCTCPNGCTGTDQCCNPDHPYLCENNGTCYQQYSDCSNNCPTD